MKAIDNLPFSIYNTANNSPRPLWKHMHTWGLSVCRGAFMATKEFKTLDEQLEILKSRSLTIENELDAKEFLRKNNYYRLSGYSLTLRDHDLFFPGTTFQNIVDIYTFDEALRHILLEQLERIENELKSVFAYEFAKKYGPLGYLNSGNFTDNKAFLKIRAKAVEQQYKRMGHEAYLQHFNKVREELPIWAYVDLLSIADISMLYQISDGNLKSDIAGNFGITVNTRAEILAKAMHGMTILKNLCAHGSRLFNRIFITKPSLSRSEKNLLRKNEDGEIDIYHVFGYILVMKKLLPSENFTVMKARIVELSDKIPFVAMRYYGFPDNWKEVI